VLRKKAVLAPIKILFKGRIIRDKNHGASACTALT